MNLNLGCIVEGQGEVAALPLLLRRILLAIDPAIGPSIRKPIRIGRHKLIKEHELERAVELAARYTPPPKGILILIDADDDCPAELGPRLTKRATDARPDVPTAVVLAKMEFESWFLASIESLQGSRGLESQIAPVEEPEAIRDAKGFLSRNMVGSRVYSPTIDQPAFAQIMDLATARRADSFDKFVRTVQELTSRVREER